MEDGRLTKRRLPHRRGIAQVACKDVHGGQEFSVQHAEQSDAAARRVPDESCDLSAFSNKSLDQMAADETASPCDKHAPSRPGHVPLLIHRTTSSIPSRSP